MSETRPEINSQEASIWRTGYTFALLLLMVVGILLIVIGTQVASDGSLANVLLISIGTTVGPASLVGLLFRVFLFEEVKYELTRPVIDEIIGVLGPRIVVRVDEVVGKYQQEIGLLRELRAAGTLHPYHRRDDALRDFASAIDAELNEIVIIGTSIRGLIQWDKSKEIADKLRFKMNMANVTLKFLLTHPVVADFRAFQEDRPSGDIGADIVESLRILQGWNVPCENVRLYKGAPTCFAIKTSHAMLLNPYPYGMVGYDSPCFIVKTTLGNPSYFYDAFEAYHFGAWDSKVAERIFNYDQTIDRLKNQLGHYSDMVQQMLKDA